MPEDRMTSRELMKLLRERYRPDRYAFVEQVPDGTGQAKGRTADAMAMGLWRSVGIYLHGFEVKVSRSDWTRELDAPEKSQRFVDTCDFWWIVATDGVVRLEELPAHWGLITPNKAKTATCVRRPATRNPSPVAVTRDLLASVFRVVARNSMDDAERQAAIEEGRKQAEEDFKREIETTKTMAANQVQQANELIRNFESLSGVNLRWNMNSAAKAAAILSTHLPEVIANRYDRLANELQQLQEVLRNTAAKLRPDLEAASA